MRRCPNPGCPPPPPAAAPSSPTPSPHRHAKRPIHTDRLPPPERAWVVSVPAPPAQHSCPPTPSHVPAANSPRPHPTYPLKPPPSYLGALKYSMSKRTPADTHSPMSPHPPCDSPPTIRRAHASPPTNPSDPVLFRYKSQIRPCRRRPPMYHQVRAPPIPLPHRKFPPHLVPVATDRTAPGDALGIPYLPRREPLPAASPALLPPPATCPPHPPAPDHPIACPKPPPLSSPARPHHSHGARALRPPPTPPTTHAPTPSPPHHPQPHSANSPPDYSTRTGLHPPPRAPPPHTPHPAATPHATPQHLNNLDRTASQPPAMPLPLLSPRLPRPLHNFVPIRAATVQNTPSLTDFHTGPTLY